MTEPADAVRLIVEGDVDGYARTGIADFQHVPHLFLSECLDWDDERRSRRLGETFFLVPVSAEAAEAVIRAYKASQADGTDPQWQAKQARAWALWLEFKETCIKPAEWAWRVRGNFRSVEWKRRRPVRFRWAPLSPQRVSGTDLRARLARLAALERERYGDAPEAGSGEELPF